MADIGALMDDFRELQGHDGGHIIDVCMAWPELRLDQGVRLSTDNWHQRFYWRNCGGSHHMAVLCYQLQQQKRERCPEVEVFEEVLDVLSLQHLADKVLIFVVMNDHHRHGAIFDGLPGGMQYGDTQQKLSPFWITVCIQ